MYDEYEIIVLKTTYNIFIHSFIHCRYLYSASSSGATQKNICKWLSFGIIHAHSYQPSLTAVTLQRFGRLLSPETPWFTYKFDNNNNWTTGCAVWQKPTSLKMN